MASAATNGKSTETSDHLFVPARSISSDSNANPSNVPSNVRRTGALPKAKQQLNAGNVQNRLTPDIHVKLNNNVPDTDVKPDVNGACVQLAEDPPVGQEKPCQNGGGGGVKTFSKSSAVSNGFKNVAAVAGGIHNGTCSQLSVFSQLPVPVNRNNRGDELQLSGESEPGPSTSRGAGKQQQQQQLLKDSESECSSDTGNDDLSCSDECCIYTYKGDMADLPRSFLNLDLPDTNEPQSRAGSRGSSPEMDFLEMDFDPGPSCDADSDESSVNSDLKSYDDLPECEEFVCGTVASTNEALDTGPNASAPSGESNNLSAVAVEEAPLPVQNVPASTEPTATPTPAPGDKPWMPKLVFQRTLCSAVLHESRAQHSARGDLVSPHEHHVFPLYHSPPSTTTTTTDDNEPMALVERTMIWTEQEAAAKQVTQIGTSACGATAVLNVLLALEQPVPSTEHLLACVPTRLRETSAPLVQYLRSRSIAGSTHRDLVHGLQLVSRGQVYARFFHTHPERYVNLSQWLSHWIGRGAVPVATLNLQRGVQPGQPVPDAWHHQMLFGVGPHGVYLTNPLERVAEGTLWHQLCSESVLLVKREDVVARWHNRTDLRELMAAGDVRWHRLNVLGQVANVVREHQRLVSPQAVSRTHVSIPVAYAAGITLAMHASNPACDALRHCAELPLLRPPP